MLLVELSDKANMKTKHEADKLENMIREIVQKNGEEMLKEILLEKHLDNSLLSGMITLSRIRGRRFVRERKQ